MGPGLGSRVRVRVWVRLRLRLGLRLSLRLRLRRRLRLSCLTSGPPLTLTRYPFDQGDGSFKGLSDRPVMGFELEP